MIKNLNFIILISFKLKIKHKMVVDLCKLYVQKNFYVYVRK
jgi:hypothetical protein